MLKALLLAMSHSKRCTNYIPPLARPLEWNSRCSSDTATTPNTTISGYPVLGLLSPITTCSGGPPNGDFPCLEYHMMARDVNWVSKVFKPMNFAFFSI